MRDGTLVAISGDVIDVVNAANRPAWLVLPGRTAVELAFAAADEADARIAALSADAVDRALEQRRRYMLDRSRHRTEHLDQIARSLGQ